MEAINTPAEEGALDDEILALISTTTTFPSGDTPVDPPLVATIFDEYTSQQHGTLQVRVTVCGNECLLALNPGSVVSIMNQAFFNGSHSSVRQSPVPHR